MPRFHNAERDLLVLGDLVRNMSPASFAEIVAASPPAVGWALRHVAGLAGHVRAENPHIDCRQTLWPLIEANNQRTQGTQEVVA
jgi:hypothetical protein